MWCARIERLFVRHIAIVILTEWRNSSHPSQVRRQFKTIPGLMEGTAEADSDTCIEISTNASIREMVLPALWAILSPLTVGFLVGVRCLTGLLAGSIATGMMLAIMMSNAGGAWDNSKKYIEIEGGKSWEDTE
jgi:K(+)-stimulated pyrophosphate-energized sodium pump